MNRSFPGRLKRLARRWLKPDPRLQPFWQRATETVASAAPAEARAGGELTEIRDFGSNPGRLRSLLYLPAGPRQPGMPLLVLMHGCGQDPVRFARASGFMTLADQLGAALLLPDQQEENNAHRCFNWFRPADTARGSGEAESIRQMVDTALRRCDGDPGRVFVAGLSAGGAMAAALLAAYPDVFAAGAVVAGLPVGAARSASEALQQMRHPSPLPRGEWIKRLGSQPGTRPPRLSVWHGDADTVVAPANADALVGQWTGLHGLAEPPDAEVMPAPHIRRRVWGAAVEQWRIAGLGHAFPVAVAAAVADPFVLPAGVDAALEMARFWGIRQE